MSSIGGPNLIKDGLVLNLDSANSKSFRGEQTTNTINYTSVSPARYNNPGFSGTIIDTGNKFLDSPIWEATFIPQDSTFIPRLGSTEGFGFFHSMGIPLLADTDYMGSVYFKTTYPLPNTSTQGFINTYSNITGWGNAGTANTRYQEGEWTRLYTRYRNSVTINSINYSIRGNSNIFSATVNTTSTTQVLVSITILTNGTFQTVTDFGSNTLGGGLTNFNFMAGIYFADPTITSAGGIVGLSTGTSAILQHGLNTSTWTKLSASNNVITSNFPFTYYLLLNIPSTGGVNATIQFRLNLTGFYTALTDNKFWKITFNTSNLQVNDVIRTYWAAPMIEQHSRTFPSKFVIGTRGTTVATGGGWADTSGNNNNGELVNGVGYNINNSGAVVFDGVDDHIVTGNLGSNFSNFTVSVWFNPDSVSSFRNVLDCNYAYNGTTGNIGPRLEMDNTGGLRWIYSESVSSNSNFYSHFVLSNGLTTNKWHHALITYNSSTNTSITYYNGKNTGISRTLSGSPTGFLGSFTNLNIGRGFHLGGTERIYIGRISNIQIYNRPLLATEVEQLFNSTKGRYNL
jgi:hypothetical protein